jgi:GTP-binding protein Era
MTNITHCGFVAIVGCPNVGKSTLLNQLLGQKISITSDKPQTTRHQILGILTNEHTQTIFVDTPGLHQYRSNALNRYMNRTAASVLNGVDVIVFVIDATSGWTKEDEWVLEKIKKAATPTILVVNKVDTIKDKKTLLPLLADINQKADFAAVIPLSAKKADNVAALKHTISELLPEGAAQYPEDQITDRSVRFLAAEIVREKIMRHTGDEIPYFVTLEVEEFKDEPQLVTIGILILVAKQNHKAIIIGKKGDHLKVIGSEARLDIEKMLAKKVFLRLWIKVREGWADDERALQSLGYQE